MAPIGDRPKNICDGRFLGWTHENKIHFIIILHGYTLPPPRGGGVCSSVRLRFFVTGYIAFYDIVLGKEGRQPHRFFDFMLPPAKFRYQCHPMGNKSNLAGLKLMYIKILFLSKRELTQARGVRSMVMWYSVPVKNFIVPVLHIQTGLVSYVLNNLLDLIDSDVEKLSTGGEVAHNTLVTLSQVI